MNHLSDWGPSLLVLLCQALLILMARHRVFQIYRKLNQILRYLSLQANDLGGLSQDTRDEIAAALLKEANGDQ